jgi:hypothetical protein
MIRNRNISADAGIDPSKIAGGIDNYFVPNNVRRVVQTGVSENYYNKIMDMMPTGMVYNTLEGAVAAADESDVIYVHAGDDVYLSAAQMTVEAPRLKIFGQQAHFGLWGSPSIHTHATDVICMAIAAHQVEIAGLGFHIQAANKGITVGAVDTSGTWRTYIHDCYFGGNGTATYGIDLGGLYDAPYSVIERCKLEDFATANILMTAHHSMVTGCHFMVKAAKIGLEYTSNGGTRPYCEILSNRFMTPDNTSAYGIKITNTPTVGMVFIDDNRFVLFHGDDHCISKRTTGYIGKNWLDDGGSTTGAPIQNA